MELFDASTEWATRPDDQRYSSLSALQRAVSGHREAAQEVVVSTKDIAAVADGDGLMLVADGHEMVPTHWAFSQVCNVIAAPAAYLRRLPASIVAQNINHGLSERENESNLMMVPQTNERGTEYWKMTAMVSKRYERIWNADIVDRIVELPEKGWRVPPARPARPWQPGVRPATEEDVLSVGEFGLSIQVGDLIAPAGLYASDHDMFVFMVNEANRIADGTDEGLSRGFFLSNSEVGAAALKLTWFYYRHVCGNHIVWGAEDVKELRVVHVTGAGVRLDDGFYGELRQITESSAKPVEDMISRAKRFRLGSTSEEVVDLLFGKQILGKKKAKRVLEIAAMNDTTDGDPFSAWGVANGITRLSQNESYADARNLLDRAGAKVLAMAQ